MAGESYREVACQQVLTADGSVFSIQWTTLPPEVATGLSPDKLLERYLAHIRRFTLSLIRPTATPDGIHFRLAGTRISLISFLPPQEDRQTVRLRICGGALVQPRDCRSGDIAFSLEPVPEGCRAAVTLSEYCPIILGSRRPTLFRKLLYRWTQAYIHRMVTVGYLVRLSRELCGAGTCIRTVTVRIREGEDV